jgi:hypothetical protein
MAAIQTGSSTEANGTETPATAASLKAGRSVLAFPTVMVTEGLHFWSRRLKAQSEFLAKVADCEGPAQAIERQVEFVRSAVNDYGREAETITHKVRGGVIAQSKAA